MTEAVSSRPSRAFRAMPVMIKIGALLSPLFAAAWLMLAGMRLAGLPIGSMQVTISVENATLTDRDPAGLAFALVVGATAYGFWMERTWARYSAIGFWVLTLALGIGGMLGGTATLWGVLEVVAITLVAWWYFFRKRAVVSYYAGLQARTTQADPAPQALIPPGA